MKKYIVLLFILAFGIGSTLTYQFLFKSKSVDFIPTPTPTPFAADRYSIPALTANPPKAGTLTVSGSLFEFRFQPDPEKNEIKKVTGVINYPTASGSHPVVFLIRGFVDQAIYTSGMGSKRIGEYLAENGYIAMAPDFLGYAGSDKEAGNIFESRFQTYTTVLSLIASRSQIPNFDGVNYFLWGHSNGGQIALTTLAVLGQNIPTVLWAPVTKPFPYSILYYLDEAEDGGKFLRRELAKFEDINNTDAFSFTNYLSQVKAPIILLQGTVDDAVSDTWSRSFCKTAKNIDLDIKCFYYAGADHNLNPSWEAVSQKTLDFFNQNLKN